MKTLIVLFAESSLDASSELPLVHPELPLGPTATSDAALTTLRDQGFTDILVHSREAPVDWHRAGVDVRPTRLHGLAARADELLRVLDRPILVVDVIQATRSRSLAAFVRACERDPEVRLGCLAHGSELVAAWFRPDGHWPLDADAASLLRHADRVVQTRPAIQTSADLLNHALDAASEGLVPSGWQVLRNGVYAHPTASIAPDTLARARGPVWLHADVTVAEGVNLEGPVSLGAGCRVDAGAALCRTVVGPRTQVHPGVRLDRTLAQGSCRWDPISGRWLDILPGPTSTIEPAPTSTERAWSTLERALEITATGSALALLSPLLAAVAVGIRLQDGHGALYVGRRCIRPDFRDEGGVHRPGHYITYPVFRTMHPGSDKKTGVMEQANDYSKGPYRKSSSDPRVTALGRVLRKTSIDELPLLWEVFRGRLSLTGVWALPVYEAADLDDPDAVGSLSYTASVRFGGPAGLAGLWQARDRSSADPVARMVHDAYQSYALGRTGGPFSPAGRTVRRLALVLETVLGTLRLNGV